MRALAEMKAESSLAEYLKEEFAAARAKLWHWQRVPNPIRSDRETYEPDPGKKEKR